MPIAWTAQAENTLHELFDAFETPDAVRVASRILESAERLLVLPVLGQTGREKGTREVIVPCSSYILSYSRDGDFVTILHVFHPWLVEEEEEPATDRVSDIVWKRTT